MIINCDICYHHDRYIPDIPVYIICSIMYKYNALAKTCTIIILFYFYINLGETIRNLSFRRRVKKWAGNNL